MGKLFIPDNETDKLPLWPMISVVCLSFLDLFCVNVSIPNIPYMCQTFFPDLASTELGYYSGILTGIYSVGGVIGNLLWGWYSDRNRRKPCLLISTIGTCICMTLFGFSTSFWMALFARFVWGLLNSTLGIVKTYVSEICNPKTQASGFAWISTAQGVARIVGPLIGGSFANPQIYFPSFTNVFPIFGQFPYLLPHFIGSVFCVFVIILTAICAPETLSKENIINSEKQKQHNANKVKMIRERLAADPNYKLSKYEENILELSRDNYFAMIRDKDVFISCLLYGLTSILQGTQDSLLPLWLLNPINQGGFLWKQSEIGWLYVGLGPVQVVFAPIIFPLLSRVISYKTNYISSGIIYGISLALHPVASLTNTSPEWLQWYSILCIVTFAICIRQCNFTSVMILITNSTYLDFRGKVNGLGQVFSSIGRAIGPSIGSSIFAWSCTDNHPFPFNFGFTFYLIGILMILFSLVAYLLPDSINNPKPYLYKEIDAAEKDIELQQVNTNDVESKDKLTPNTDNSNSHL